MLLNGPKSIPFKAGTVQYSQGSDKLYIALHNKWMQQYPEYLLWNRRKTLTGSPDPTRANGTNRPCIALPFLEHIPFKQIKSQLTILWVDDFTVDVTWPVINLSLEWLTSRAVH